MPEGVSCLCLTYGRPELLEEAIESFKRQQWAGPKELIVVNDHPDQEILCTDNEIVIFNLKSKAPHSWRETQPFSGPRQVRLPANLG